MARMLSEAEKAAAKEKATATRAFTGSEDALAVVGEYGPRWQELERSVRDICTETGVIVGEMANVLDVPATADGKKRLMMLVGACTESDYLRATAALWASVILGGQEVEKITTWKELREGAKAGNVKLGVKSRGRREKVKGQAQQIAAPDIWSLLGEVLKTQAGRSKVREMLNAAGYEMIPLGDVAKMVPAPELDPILNNPAASVLHKPERIRKAA